MDMHSSEWETIYRDSKQFKHILSSKQNKTAFNALLVRETQKQSAATTLRTNMLIRTFNQILADVNNNILPWGVISFDTYSSISDEKNDNNKRQLIDNIKDKKKPHRKFLLILPGIIWDCHTVEVEEDLKNKLSSKEEK